MVRIICFRYKLHSVIYKKNSGQFKNFHLSPTVTLELKDAISLLKKAIEIIRKASVLDVSLGIWHYDTIGEKTPQVGEEKKYWSVSSNAGQQEEASRKTLNSSTRPDNRCPGEWLSFAGRTMSQTKGVLTAIS